jgi:hypothetical protein
MNTKQNIHKILFFVFIIIVIYYCPSSAQIDNECGFISLRAGTLPLIGDTVRTRPNLSDEQILNTQNFKIHYTLSGLDATDTNWVNAVAEYAEYSRQQFTSMGWLPPPLDDGDGGDTKYDIYIRLTPYNGAAIRDSNVRSPYN